MKKTNLTKLLVLLLLAALATGLCPLASAEEAYASAEDVIAAMESGFAKRAEQYAPAVKTLSNGVKVQRTPSSNATGFHTDYNLGYNNFALNADNRGCGTCHEALETTVGAWTEIGDVRDYPHPVLDSGFNSEYTVSMCMDCHNNTGHIPANKVSAGSFGALMHGYHDKRNAAFTAMGGDCWSCHYASEDGMLLWDEVKHDVLLGINTVSNANMNGVFAWDQDKLTSRDDHFSLIWHMNKDAYANTVMGVEPDPENDGVYDVWTFSVEGDVENPFTMTISEMLEIFPLETKVITFECNVNPMGGTYIANSEITGIPVSALLEYAQPKEGATAIEWMKHVMHIPLEWVEDYGCWLVLEIDGKPLTYDQGYPVEFVSGFGGAYLNDKWATSLTVESDELPMIPDYYGKLTDEGVFMNSPNCGIFDLREGQIFQLGEEITFEGYAHAMASNISAVELSFDKGKTWTTLEVENADPTRWVHWTYTWLPESTGSYVISARSINIDGTVSPHSVDVMFNVQ